MPDFTSRAIETELMDRNGVSSQEIHLALKELNIINRLLGGHSTTLAALKRLVPEPNEKLQIIDFGCGGGGSLKRVQDWAQKQGIQTQLTGIDIRKEAVNFTKTLLGDTNQVRLKQSDYREFQVREKEYDIAMASLFCHHFYDDDLIHLLSKMQKSARLGVIINDLHRHPVAYYSIKLLTRTFSRSRLVKFDAPLSVRRGFVRMDLIQALEKAGISDYSIQWRWAFRYLVTYH